MDEKRFDRLPEALARSKAGAHFLPARPQLQRCYGSPRRSTSAQSSLPCWDAKGRPKPSDASLHRSKPALPGERIL